MIDGLHLVGDTGEPGLLELGRLLTDLLGASADRASLVDVENLCCYRVLRLRFEVAGHQRSMVVKRLLPHGARAEQAALRRWLPAAGLHETAQTLLGDTSDQTGRVVWHVYGDLGNWSLANRDLTDDALRIAVALIAGLHTRCAGHDVLEECRDDGAVRGIAFYDINVERAMQNLEKLDTPPVEHQPLRDRLMARMERSLSERRDRSAHMAEYGGPETLLHGDLWTGNVFVVPSEHGFTARLIDWDKSGAGPVAYDLSAFLQGFGARDRVSIMRHYRRELRPFGWTLPADRQLNRLFETAEHARIANVIAWLAGACLDPDPDWAYEELAEVDSWPEAIPPILDE